MRRMREITSEEENHRYVPLFEGRGVNAVTSKVDPVEAEPVGTAVAMAFRITGFDPDCDGSLMMRLEHIGDDGKPTGWEVNCIGQHPSTVVVLDDDGELFRLADRRASEEYADSQGGKLPRRPPTPEWLKPHVEGVR